MRKTIISLLLLASSLTLCSCRVNWFTTTVEVPWYAVAIPVAVIFAVAYLILMNTTFVCPDCHTEFKPKWYQLSVTVHFMGKRLVKCPRCGKKGFFEKRR